MLYDEIEFSNISGSEDSTSRCTVKNDSLMETQEDILQLIRLLKNERNFNKINSTIDNFLQMELTLMFIEFIYVIWKLVEQIIGQSAIARHVRYWQICVRNYDFKSGKAWTLIVDVVAGLIFMIGLLILGNLSGHLIRSTEILVEKLRFLLDSLKGSPVGLKLNVQLNNFFLDCFTYHVDLWATFLVIVSPAIYYLFIPLTIIGCFGLSFQLAMLSDLVTLISLHAHCFYIYASVLYNIEIIGIKTLWRVLLGRRKNILKGRMESYEYTKPQLYLATLFFATQLYLLPTVLVYYIVFATLRFCVYCITYTLLSIQKFILHLPIYAIFLWICGIYLTAHDIKMEFKESETKSITIMSLQPKLSSPWKQIKIPIDNNNDQLQQALSISHFLTGLLKGEIFGFLQPIIKRTNK